jgi:Fe-S cluster biogenesis protein NfuA/nitrite reductase/ring-hydroxylating ferredoxin subunit
MQDSAVRAEVQALDELLAGIEQLPAGEAQDAALAAIEGFLRVYGEALRRITARCDPATIESLRADELISQLLLLHELHPATLEERITAALEEVRPYMGSHGGGIELVGVSDGVAKVRLEGTCSGCVASTVTLKLAVEEAVLRAAPELHGVEAVEAADQAVGLPAGALLPMFESRPVAAPLPVGRWLSIGQLDVPDGDQPLRLDVAGIQLLLARAGDDLYAYLDRCPGCRAQFEAPRLEADALSCGGCGRRYDIRRAGVGIDGGLLQLEPVPLLVEDGQVRVAVEAVLA